MDVHVLYPIFLCFFLCVCMLGFEEGRQFPNQWLKGGMTCTEIYVDYSQWFPPDGKKMSDRIHDVTTIMDVLKFWLVDITANLYLALRLSKFFGRTSCM